MNPDIEARLDTERLTAVPHRRWTWAALAAIVFVAAILRTHEVGRWPPFVDEDIYTWTSWEMLQQPLEVALVHSTRASWKPPLPLLLQGHLGALFGDVLASGRLLSALAGLCTTVLCFYLGRRLGGPAVGLVTALLYALSPLAVLHERMVLHDPLMSPLALAAVLVSWRALDRESWALAGLAASLGALAVQMKVPALVIAVLPIALAITERRGRSRNMWRALLMAAGPIGSYLLLMLTPTGVGLAQQNSGHMSEFSWSNPLMMFWRNSEVLLDAVRAYFPGGLPVVIFIGMAFAFWRAPRAAVMFVLAVVIVGLPFLVFSRFAPSRYYLPAAPYVLALAAVALVRLPVAARGLGLVPGMLLVFGSAAIVAASGVASLRIVSDPRSAVLSRIDDFQYRSGWPAAVEYAEARRFLNCALPRNSEVAFMIDSRHRVAMGLLRPLPPGVVSLGLLRLNDRLPVDTRGTLYVVVDDIGDAERGERLRELLARQPDLQIVAHFARIRSRDGVTVLRRPRDADPGTGPGDCKADFRVSRATPDSDGARRPGFGGST
jgi:MFS family permease